ncbi:MAG: cytochrome c oxidase cbb3-type subunit [Verrucomicrobiota bacterium]
MNYGPLIFLGAFFALSCSWFGLILKPQMQIGHLQQTNAVGTGATYPLDRPGLAHQGAEIYRKNGCASCHSQQVGQIGTVCDVVLAEAGTNGTAVRAALLKIKPGQDETEARDLIATLPQQVLKGANRTEADAAAKTLKDAGAKAELWIIPVGPDIARGWGKRRTVAEDFLYDSPVLPGSQRIGPDLANAGARLSIADWQLRHLYDARIEVPGSVMPPYRFLFENRKIGRAPSPEALTLPANFAPAPGREIVPRQEAKMLVAYLLSLNADAPLYETPVTLASAAPPPTNAPSGTGTNAPSAGATNGATNTTTNAPAAAATNANAPAAAATNSSPFTANGLKSVPEDSGNNPTNATPTNAAPVSGAAAKNATPTNSAPK